MKFKKLLIITSAFPDQLDTDIGGIFVKEQAEYLKDYFDEIHVISLYSIRRSLLKKPHYANYSWDNIHVYYIPMVGLPQSCVPNILKSLWLKIEKREVLKLIRSEDINFDLIHAHDTWFSGAIAVELKKDFDIPVVITEHTSITLKKALERKDKYFIDTWAKSDAVIRVREKDIPTLKLFNKNSIYVPNGFNEKKAYLLDKELCRDTLGLMRDIKIIFSLGFLAEHKGHKYLINAMRDVVERRKDVLCLIAGSGPLENSLRKEIENAGLESYVKLTGFISWNENLPFFINACDIFAHPSLSESFGIVQIEAMACGKPVVATFNGGSEEIIVSEELGYLVEPQDSRMLAEEILKALDKDWDSGRIIEYARGFCWKNIVKRIITIYDEIEMRERG